MVESMKMKRTLLPLKRTLPKPKATQELTRVVVVIFMAMINIVLKKARTKLILSNVKARGTLSKWIGIGIQTIRPGFVYTSLALESAVATMLRKGIVIMNMKTKIVRYRRAVLAEEDLMTTLFPLFSPIINPKRRGLDCQ